jgi:citrate synthase
LLRAADLALYEAKNSGRNRTTLGKIPAGVPMMDILRTGASALAHWDPDAADGSHAANLRKAEHLLAQLPIVMAARYRLAKGQKPVAYDPKLSLAGNILWMLFEKAPTERLTKAMDVSLILYAEHEYNASTFAARVVVSTLSDMHSAITAAIGALKGPLHGGANEAVMEVLKEVGTAKRAEAWIRDALANKRRIMGFGHRVYKTGDPRAAYLRTVRRVGGTGNQDMEAGRYDRNHRSQREKLPPNWTGRARLCHHMGLTWIFTTAVLSRVTGWAARDRTARQQSPDPPRANYTGPPPRKWTPEGR